MDEKIWKNENEFSKDVHAFLEEKLSAYPNYDVKEYKNVVTDFTFHESKKGDGYELVAGFQQQDIVIYKKTSTIKPWGKIFGEACRPYGIGESKSEGIIIPLVILELKIKFNTHNLITYSGIANKIKTFFPCCSYCYVLGRDTQKKCNIETLTIERQGKGFDKVFLDWATEKEKIWHFIENKIKDEEER